MKLIVGLGNPGESYRQTRHNAGRLLIESLASRLHADCVQRKTLKASTAEIHFESFSATIAYPDTYVNESGQAVEKLIRHFSADPKKDLLIVVDDVALPLGKIRLREKGSDGGHNGLKSINQVLGTNHFSRLRLGVGYQEGVRGEFLKDYVLDKFSSRDKKTLADMIQRAEEACLVWLSLPTQKAMTVVNASQPIS